ncbi:MULTISPECIES: hypothetical protein [Streptomyces]|uniref:Uncharacterized protein n=1 Tax=Streptomyces antimycoticus TaxID=68175 RepID=A0ABD5JA33_9ACTN|nr:MULTISPECIES: hypothetical protein [Streptomyces]MEE4585255.1 hypothetical protein [Streptomyces sp. DSM 41602]QTI89234.1 hypothetical protein AS97_52475 [Streptomyces sp. AgN23]
MGDDEESKKAKTDYACAGERHYEDAAYLHGDGRLLNADHLFGLAVECLMKGLLLRFAGPHHQVSMRNSGGSDDDRLWWDDPDAKNQNKKRKALGHINEMRKALPLLLDGRPGLSLTEALTRVSADFEKWIVNDRYTDGTHLDRALLSRRQEAATLAHELHLHVQFTGKLP